MRREKMRMWQAAEALMAEVDGLIRRVRAEAPNATGHLERSCESALFNTAEGIGAFPPKTKINAYEIAKKEANEARAILRRLVIKQLLTDAEIDRAYRLAGALISMLTSAILTLKNR